MEGHPAGAAVEGGAQDGAGGVGDQGAVDDQVLDLGGPLAGQPQAGGGIGGLEKRGAGDDGDAADAVVAQPGQAVGVDLALPQGIAARDQAAEQGMDDRAGRPGNGVDRQVPIGLAVPGVGRQAQQVGAESQPGPRQIAAMGPPRASRTGPGSIPTAAPTSTTWPPGSTLPIGWPS
jgi:hypothetical protein